MNNNGTCISCPDDVNCDKDGSTLATVKLKPGAWRPNAESEEIFECPIKNSCLGGISIDTYVGDSFKLHCASHTTLNETVQEKLAIQISGSSALQISNTVALYSSTKHHTHTHIRTYYFSNIGTAEKGIMARSVPFA